MGPLAFATQLLGALPALIQAGVAVSDLIDAGKDKLQQFQDERRDPTAAEWDELNASIAAKRELLHK